MDQDKLLIEQIKGDDQRALERLFRKYYFPLCQFAASFVKRTDLAEEIVADVFFKIWEGRHSLEIQYNFKSYLFIAIKNQSLKAMRTNNITFEEIGFSEIQLQSDHHSGELSIQYRETEKHIERIIEELPPQRRLIFTLNRLEGFKYKEIAEILQISVHTVQKQMMEAIRHISKYESEFHISCIPYFIFLTYYVISH
ncbi:RNA polymerase sigma factor [Robertkochia solimangrovi]|uniref:RNA polymerase sigma factor n=1 Tax=Robertkochia solimangrovi TaxID=2213046 RepID=UPI00117EFE36|nr:RNA polymerase sigma-70 factor [Robertkochia solimangrovi]TRZ45717.1 hypothetical protein DMZ48_00090 [Robertkochia solimangrovi]